MAAQENRQPMLLSVLPQLSTDGFRMEQKCMDFCHHQETLRDVQLQDLTLPCG